MKGRKGRETGGVVAKDKKPEMVYAGAGSNVAKEADEYKRGGKAIGKMKGAKGKANMGRAPRKSGGRTGSNMNPLSSAAAGSKPAGRKLMGD
ncbi:MAG: hypothetical protein ACR2IJ_05685 [Fluviibacter sp.]